MATVGLFNGVAVYAPWCRFCNSDVSTHWEDLPTVNVNDATSGGPIGWGICLRCEKEVNAGRLETWRAREPERLAARLAELKAEAESNARASCIRDVELTREQVTAQATEFARHLNFASFDDVLVALDAGSIKGSANELHARTLKHLLGK